MYDKTVRRRRAVLGLLVACSLILLTAYFGENRGGPLHEVQRGFSGMLNPVSDGASRALKPVRDLFGWFGDTLEAKGDVEDLRAERDAMRTQLLRAQAAAGESAQLRRMLELQGALSLDAYRPLSARVTVTSPTLWYATIRVNKGTSDGVEIGQPVLNEEALIGTVTEVFGGSAQVTLITDSESSVSAKTVPEGTFGIVQPASAGNPNDLIFEFPTNTEIEEGDRVVTRGTVSDQARLRSLFPSELPIGEVTRVENPGTDTQEVHLRPFAEMRSLDFVQILTRPQGAGEP